MDEWSFLALSGSLFDHDAVGALVNLGLVLRGLREH